MLCTAQGGAVASRRRTPRRRRPRLGMSLRESCSGTRTPVSGICRKSGNFGHLPRNPNLAAMNKVGPNDRNR